MDSPPTGPTGDPFFDAVRRRHPDVDLVVLPPELPSVPAPPADRATAEALAEVVLAEATSLWDTINTEDLTERPQLAYVAGGQPGTVRSTARVLVPETDRGFLLLAALRQAVPGLDYRDGPVSWIEGRSGVARLRASYAESTGFFQLELSSGALQVGQPVLDALRGGL